MRSLSSLLAAVLAFAVLDVAEAARNLPAHTTLDDYVALITKAAGKPKNPHAVSEGPYGWPGFTSETGDISIGLYEHARDGKTADDIVATISKAYGQWCENKAVNSKTISKQTFGSVVLVRASNACHAMGDDIYGELIVVADDTRFEAFDYGGLAKTKSDTVGIGDKLAKELAAAYR